MLDSPAYGSSRHRFAGRGLQGGEGWTRTLGRAWARRSAPTTLAWFSAPERQRRMRACRKQDAVLRLLRGEDLELLARQLGVTAAELSGGREAFLAARRGVAEDPACRRFEMPSRPPQGGRGRGPPPRTGRRWSGIRPRTAAAPARARWRDRERRAARARAARWCGRGCSARQRVTKVILCDLLKVARFSRFSTFGYYAWPLERSGFGSSKTSFSNTAKRFSAILVSRPLELVMIIIRYVLS